MLFSRDRYACAPFGGGWTVYDAWTGQPVVLAEIPQVGLVEAEARDVAELLNRAVGQGDRSILQ